MSLRHCGRCDTSFECDVDAAVGCWCSAYPPVLPVDDARDCLCPDCLALAVAAAIKNRLETCCGLDAMLQLARPYQSESQLVENIDYTVEAGRYVFTRWYHLKRGHCCGNGCRHCPFGHTAVLSP